MSSGAGEAGGVGGLDLNFVTGAVLDEHEAGAADAVEDAPVSICGELVERERGESLDVRGDEKNECVRGIADREDGMVGNGEGSDREDGMVGNGEGSAASVLEALTDVAVLGNVGRDAGAESHGGKLLEVDVEKGCTKPVSVSTVGFEDVVASNQTMNLGDGSGDNQNRGAAIDMEGVMGTDEISSTVLVDDGRTGDERSEVSAILRREQVGVQLDLVDGGGELADGQLDLEERVPDGESFTVKLIEADTGEKEITGVATVLAVDRGNQAVSLGNVSGDQKQGINMDVEGLVIDHQLGSGEREAEVVSRGRNFLEVEKREEESSELAVVSTEEFEHVEASIHTVDFRDGSDGDQRRRTDLVAELDLGEKGSAVSTVGFDAVEASNQSMYLGDGFNNDQNQIKDANKKEMVRTDEGLLTALVCGGLAVYEKLEGSSNLREEHAYVELVDAGVQAVDNQLSPEEREAEGESLHIKLLEMDIGGRESADLVSVSAEVCKAIDVSNQAVMERVTEGSETTVLVAVPPELIEAVEASNLVMNLVDGFGGDQKQGTDLDAEGTVMDAQFDRAESDAEVKSLSGKFLEMDKGDEGSALLVSVSDEDFQPVEASRTPIDFHDGSGGDQKRGTVIDEEGMVIDGDLGSGKREAEVETPGDKPLEMDMVKKGSTVLVPHFTESFEHAKVCSQVMDLSYGSGEDQSRGVGLNVESMAGINEDSIAISVRGGGKLLEDANSEKRSADPVAVSSKVFELVEASSHAINLVHRSGDDQRLVVGVDAEGVVSNETSITCGGRPEDERSEPSFILIEKQVDVWDDLGDGRGQVVDGEPDTRKREAEFKSYSGNRSIEVNMGEKVSAKLFCSSSELPEAVEACSEAMNLGDGPGGDTEQSVDVDMVGLMGTDGVSLTVLVVDEGVDNEKTEGSSTLRREQFEVQVDESDQALGAQIGCRESKAEFDSHEGMPLELHTGEKGAALIAASAEDFDAVEASNQAMDSGDGSRDDQIQGIAADAEGMNQDVQLGPAERIAELNSISRELLEVDQTEKKSAEPVAVSTARFERVETMGQAMDFGDESDGDQKGGTDINVEGMALDAESSPGKSVAEVESHGEKVLEVDRDDEGSTELPTVSTEGFLTWKANSETLNLIDGYGGNQRLETEVDAASMVRADDDPASISLASGASEDARLEELLISRKEDLVFQDNLVDKINDAVEREVGTAISLPEVKSYGEKCMDVDMVEKGSKKLVVASTEQSEAVEAGSQAMDLGSGSGSDHIPRTDVDAEGMARNADSVTVLIVGGTLGIASLEGSLPSGKEKVEVLVHSLDGCGQNENEFESHDTMLLEVELREKRTDPIAASAGSSQAAEVSCQAMNLGDRSGVDQVQGTDVNTEDSADFSDDTAAVSAGGEGSQDEQKQESDVGAVCALKNDEYSAVASIDSRQPKDEMLNGSSNLIKELEFEGSTHGTGCSAEDLPESTKNESTGYDPIIHAAQNRTEFCGCQMQDTDVVAENMVGGTEQVSLAVSVSGEEPEDERLEISYEFREKHDDFGEDNIRPGTPNKKWAHPENIGGSNVDAMRDTGHVKELLQSKHGEDLGSGGEFGVDRRIGSCMESDVELLDFTVACQGAEAQGLEAAPESDGKQVKVKCGDESHMVEKVAHFQDRVDRVNVNVVYDLAEGHPHEMEDEIIPDSGHNLSQVNSELPAGEEIMIKKDLACLPVVGVDHNIMHHALDDWDPGNEGYNQETVATDKKQDNSLESFRDSGLVLMGVEADIVHHSPAGTERIEVFTQASSVENDPKIYNENTITAGETVKKLDSIPVIDEKDTTLRQVDGVTKIAVVSGNIVECSNIEMTAMALNMPVNVEVWGSDEHEAVDNMEDKGNALLEDNGSVMNVESAKLQNGYAPLNFDDQSQKIDSSSLMVSCREEEASALGSHLHGNVFMEKGYSNMEDSNSLLGISMPDSSAELDELSVGCQDLQPPNIPPKEHEELELVQGTPTALHTVDTTIDCSLKMQDGTPENLKESENQSEGCDDTRADSASTSQQATYYLCFPEKEGFYTSDLVWGKVKSHPWWPGQIFDFSGASQLAIKYQKKDHFLVAYFGDKTFAWCEESRLKPFHLFYSQMEKQTSSDSFLRALRDILVEISRRVELSMICLCLPEETYADLKYQKVENAGVRGKIVDSVFDRCEIVNYFHPGQFLEYVRSLAQLPLGGADRLELTVVQAQLKAFYRSRGYTELPAFIKGSGLVENDFEIPMSKKLIDNDLDHSATLSDLFSTKGKLKSRDGSLGNQKQIVEYGRKQKSLSELMDEKTTFLLVNRDENASEVQEDENCVSCGNKRKALDYVSTDIGRSKTKKVDAQVDEETKLLSPTSNSSFKVGAFISRAASKLTSGQPIRKCHSETYERGMSKTDDWSVDYMDLDDFFDVPFDYPKLQIDISVDYPPTNEMLYKLCLAARNPLKGHNFSSTVINFFCIFRNVHVSNTSIEKNKTEKPRAKRGRKKKIILDLESPDMSTPDHMKDSYWSDMIIPEKDAPLNPPKRRGRKKRKFTEESSPTSLMLNSSPSDCEPKLHTGAICPHVIHMLTAERPIISVEEKIIDERTPTAVILYFNSSNSLPSDLDLIRIFSRYGPLKEEETFIERKNNSAMVVFKKRTDAEMAFSGAGNFSTFGPALLSYRLRHFPFQSSPVNQLIGEDDATLIKDGTLGNLAEPEFNGALDGNLCEAVNKESSFFVQSQGHFGTVPEIPPGEFSELAQYRVGHVVVADSALTNTGREEQFQDVPAPMETGAAADHLLLESLDQEFSYFDLVQAEAGNISGIEVGAEKSPGLLFNTTEVSFPANDRSLCEESCNPATVGATPEQLSGTGTSDSVAEQLENGRLLETAIQVDAVDIPDKFNIAPDQPGEKECSDCPAPGHAGAGTSDQSSITIDAQLMEADPCAVEVREATTLSDSTQIELEGRGPSAEVPIHVTELR